MSSIHQKPSTVEPNYTLPDVPWGSDAGPKTISEPDYARQQEIDARSQSLGRPGERNVFPNWLIDYAHNIMLK